MGNKGKKSNGLYHALNLERLWSNKQNPLGIVKKDYLKKHEQEIYILTNTNKMSFNSLVIVKQLCFVLSTPNEISSLVIMKQVCYVHSSRALGAIFQLS